MSSVFSLRVLILAVLGMVPCKGFAQSFCALTVQIQRFDGRPAANTWVELIDPSGMAVQKMLVKGDTLRICDFGFGAHSIRVGSNECHPITVSNLRLRLGHPIVLQVRKNQCEVVEEHTGCDLLLRVANKEGKAIAAATVRIDGSALHAATDEFGRLSTLLAAGYRDIAVSASGYESKTISINCKDGLDVERQIVLAALGK